MTCIAPTFSQYLPDVNFDLLINYLTSNEDYF